MVTEALVNARAREAELAAAVSAARAVVNEKHAELASARAAVIDLLPAWDEARLELRGLEREALGPDQPPAQTLGGE